jgi:hypothetical protein
MTTTNAPWHNLYITDKTGKKYWSTTCEPYALTSEINNLTRHLDNIAKGSDAYSFVDASSAVLVVDGQVYSYAQDTTENTMSDDDLLNELFGE